MALDLAGIAVLITTVAGACIGVISQVQHSRCVKLRVCWGMCDCIRSVPDVAEPTVELTPSNRRIEG